MGLKRPEDYVASLNDGRVTYWDGENIADITKHPRFRVPIALTAKDYEYDDPRLGALRRYKAEDGSDAHRIYQIPTQPGGSRQARRTSGAHLDRHGGLGRLHGADERQGPGRAGQSAICARISSACTAIAATTTCAPPR